MPTPATNSPHTPAPPQPAAAGGVPFGGGWAGQPGMPPHTQTQSTLAPTAEFTRIFLLAWIIRYIFRGASGALFKEVIETPGLRGKILNALSSPGRLLHGWLGGKASHELSELEAAAYSASIGIGSGALTWQYGKMVKTDIVNMFRESVAEEKGIPQQQVTFDDISRSDNIIIRRTVENYHSKLHERLLTDGLFLLGAPLKSGHITDLFLGVKGIQIFADTWKRKTTMFEDLVSFVNNKINPRNGLGQPVSIGEVFDLYQHYAEAFQPEKAFTQVMNGSSTDVERWRQGRPVFQRITELMNQTYAYKQPFAPMGDAGTPPAVAHFALPQLIYLLGHRAIDPDKPSETLTAIEVVNRHGIPAAKAMHDMLARGQSLAQVQAHFGVTLPPMPATHEEPGKNGVIAKGSTMQLDAAPATKIDAASVAGERLTAAPALPALQS